MTTPLTGALNWQYRTFTYAGGISLREIQYRYMAPSVKATRLLTLTSVGFPPLNTPAFAGHTTGRAPFRASGFPTDFTS